MPRPEPHPIGVPPNADPRHRRWGRFEWTLLAVLVLGVAIRFAYFWFERRPNFAEVGVVGDAIFYHRGANLLADGKGLINTIYFDKYSTIHQDGHPPLYIFWLTIP